MKLLLCLLVASSYAYAGKKTEWSPKYQKTDLKVIDKTILKSSGKKSKLSKTNAKTKKTKIIPSTRLEALFLKAPKNRKHLLTLKSESLKQAQKAVPTLLKVIKGKDYPNENRWVAIYMLGRIMGKKSAPYISHFAKHPNWMLRLASLKVLLHLNQKQYTGIFARLLEDESLIVRHQALQNIKAMKIKSLAPYVWKMLYNKKNYVGMKGERKRNNIIKDAIKTIGDLGFAKAKGPMLKMFKKNKYKDVYSELDYSLSRLSNKPSPSGNMALKKNYWNRMALKEVTIL